jgi:thiol-disulfide isomerase/thioredoxin
MRGWLVAAASLTVSALASSAFALEIGDKAPALEIKTWVQGEPIALADGAGKKVFVVEFWATWCGPCKTSIPHLSRLAEKFKAQGLEVIGVTAEDDVDLVKDFAKDGKFKYRVAVDADKNTNGAYMEGVPGIPHAFVIDQQGTVVWAGHPMGGLDYVVEKVLAGKFDVAKSKEAAALVKEMQATFSTKDPEQIGAAAEKVLAAAPYDPQAFDLRAQCLKAKKDVAGYKAFIAALMPKIDDVASALNNVAATLAGDGNVEYRDLPTAYKAAKRAVELTQGKDADIVDTLAQVLHQAGLLDQAIETQKKAVALDPTSEQLKKTLAYYESCAEVRKQAGGAAGGKPKK